MTGSGLGDLCLLLGGGLRAEPGQGRVNRWVGWRGRGLIPRIGAGADGEAARARGEA